MAMRRAAIFVLSDVRSGSTLLDQCLGAHRQVVSLGEVHWLHAYLSQDRRIYDPEHPLECTCGKPVAECVFWNAVGRELGRPLASLQLRSTLSTDEQGHSRTSTLARLPNRVFRLAPGLFRFGPVRSLFGGHRMARDSIDLFDAVAEVTGCELCVDSSKSPLRFRSVYDLQPDRTVAVILSRDYRAVVHSKMKRGAKLEIAATGWRRKMRQIDALTSGLPRKHLHYVKYEEFCAYPRAELGRLCEFLGIEFAEEMLHRPSENVHHIGGSPSKLDPGRSRIELDQAYLNRFRGDELARLKVLVGHEAARWGY